MGDIQGGSMTRFYVTPFLDQNLSMTVVGGAQAGIYYYSQDGLGSVRTLTDSAGNLTNHYDHDAFGVPLPVTTSETVPQRYTYTGRETSGVNGGPMYYRYRGYEEELGRFGQRDPMRYMAGINIYCYVEGRVTTKKDPRGLDYLRHRETGLIREIGPYTDPPWALVEVDVPPDATSREAAEANRRAMQEDTERIDKQRKEQEKERERKAKEDLHARIIRDAHDTTTRGSGRQFCCGNATYGNGQCCKDASKSLVLDTQHRWQVLGYLDQNDCASSLRSPAFAWGMGIGESVAGGEIAMYLGYAGRAGNIYGALIAAEIELIIQLGERAYCFEVICP